MIIDPKESRFFVPRTLLFESKRVIPYGCNTELSTCKNKEFRTLKMCAGRQTGGTCWITHTAHRMRSIAHSVLILTANMDMVSYITELYSENFPSDDPIYDYTEDQFLATGVYIDGYSNFFNKKITLSTISYIFIDLYDFISQSQMDQLYSKFEGDLIVAV